LAVGNGQLAGEKRPMMQLKLKSVAMKIKTRSQVRLKATLLMVTFLLLLTAEAQNVKWNCIPGKNAGPITIGTSEEKLKAIFGAHNVRNILEERPYGEPPKLWVTHLLNSGVPYSTVYWRNDKKGTR
jgi:hypothetical protein